LKEADVARAAEGRVVVANVNLRLGAAAFALHELAAIRAFGVERRGSTDAAAPVAAVRTSWRGGLSRTAAGGVSSLLCARFIPAQFDTSSAAIIFAAAPAFAVLFANRAGGGSASRDDVADLNAVIVLEEFLVRHQLITANDHDRSGQQVQVAEDVRDPAATLLRQERDSHADG
jgi:hypothetical protein